MKNDQTARNKQKSAGWHMPFLNTPTTAAAATICNSSNVFSIKADDLAMMNDEH
jgi:hypothetical protein